MRSETELNKTYQALETGQVGRGREGGKEGGEKNAGDYRPPCPPQKAEALPTSLPRGV